jgi:endonuclease YncB( thermonuclease family)
VRTFRIIAVLGWLALFGATAAADPRGPANAAASSVGFGDFKLDRVVDGDTIRVKGLDSSLRLLGIDTEETFKHDKERRAYANGFAAYAKAARGSLPRPAKFATPLGDAAKTWAEAWFAGVDTVRLERDDPHELRDRYRRYLAYVLVEKHGTWLNYNVEAVRAGMSPYFPKYGRSRRYDHDFIAAEAQAKAAHRGIWAAGAEAYPDYPEREAWWTARGDFIATFRGEAARGAKHAPMIDLTHDDAAAQLEAEVGHEVVVLGTVGAIYRAGAPSKPARTRKHHDRASPGAGDAANGDPSSGPSGGPSGERDDGLDDGPYDGPANRSAAGPNDDSYDGADDARPRDADHDDSSGDRPSGDWPSDNRTHGKAPTRVMLDNHVALVFFDPDVFAASGLEAWKGEWIRVTGKPSLYKSKLQIVIDRTAQIELSAVPGLTKPTIAAPAKPARNRKQSVPIHAP